MGLKQLDGLPIIDAKRPIKLIISPRDISGADPKKPHACAVALACERQLHAKEVRVHLGRVYVRTNDQNWQRYKTPSAMRSEIIAFDRGGSFEPGEYTLEKPPVWAQTTGKRQGGPRSAKKGRATGRNQPRHIVKDVRTGPA